MKVLIVGSGGREHAIAYCTAKSEKVDKIYCTPGNAGIAEYAECAPIGAMEFDKIVAFAKEKAVDLVIVGMDDPLVGGLVDELEAAGIRTFGPRKNAAILEGSKAFSKDLMKKYHIPTAGYENFTDAKKALAYLETAKFPIVLKADGLALGKGVLICNTLEEAKEGVKTIMLDRKFGDAGNEMVIEEFMTGREVSVLSFVDGNTIKTMTSAQDHKRAGDGDTGLNTGGMGTFSPSPFYTKEVEDFCNKYIYQATVDAMKAAVQKSIETGKETIAKQKAEVQRIAQEKSLAEQRLRQLGLFSFSEKRAVREQIAQFTRESREAEQKLEGLKREARKKAEETLEKHRPPLPPALLGGSKSARRSANGDAAEKAQKIEGVLSILPMTAKEINAALGTTRRCRSPTL